MFGRETVNGNFRGTHGGKLAKKNIHQKVEKTKVVFFLNHTP